MNTTELLQAEAYLREKNKLGNKFEIVGALRKNLYYKSANSIGGGGFKFDSKDTKLQEAFCKLDKLNRLDNLFHFMQRQKAEYGRSIITINKNKNGDVMLNICSPAFYNASQVARCFVTEVLAIIYQRIVIDNYHLVLKSVYDTQKCVNEWYEEGMGGKLVLWDADGELPEQYKIDKVGKHNLGFVPVVESFNYPFVNTWWMGVDFTSLTDGSRVLGVEEAIIDTYENFLKEINFCHSRIAVENATQEFIATLKNNGTGRFDFGDYILQTDVGSKMTAVPGQGDFTKYIDTLNGLFDLYFKIAGFNRFSDGKVQKSSAEVLDATTGLSETNKIKIRHNQQDVKILLAKTLAAMGVLDYEKEWNFDFTIFGDVDKTSTVYLDNILKQINANTLSIVEAISLLRDIPLEKAETVFDAIKEFNDKNDFFNIANNDFEGSTPQREGGANPKVGEDEQD